jgi:hypothetical protein
VFDAGETVIELPIPTNVPPQEPVYHLQLALAPKEPPLTESTVDSPGHIAPVPEIDEAAVDKL